MRLQIDSKISLKKLEFFISTCLFNKFLADPLANFAPIQSNPFVQHHKEAIQEPANSNEKFVQIPRPEETNLIVEELDELIRKDTNNQQNINTIEDFDLEPGK